MGASIQRFEPFINQSVWFATCVHENEGAQDAPDHNLERESGESVLLYERFQFLQFERSCQEEWDKLLKCRCPKL